MPKIFVLILPWILDTIPSNICYKYRVFNYDSFSCQHLRYCSTHLQYQYVLHLHYENFILLKI